MNAATSIFRQNGVRGLYQGVTPNLWGAGASWGLYFLAYVITMFCTYFLQRAVISIALHFFVLSSYAVLGMYNISNITVLFFFCGLTCKEC